MSGRTSRSDKSGRQKKAVSIIRSSAAEYLTFVAASGSGGIEAVYADESIWLTLTEEAQGPRLTGKAKARRQAEAENVW